MSPSREDNLRQALEQFRRAQQFRSKGPLCVALVVTDHAKRQGLPLDSETLLTDGGGQVLGLGKSTVQAILDRHGISRVLASEGGRTSRGSISNMRAYVALLNELHAAGRADLGAIEDYWIGHVRGFFAAKPFKIRLDMSRGLRHIVGDILTQAETRQRDVPGVQYAGAVLQHIVGAKLAMVLGRDKVEHHSFSTADSATGRAGDFRLEDVAVHVTTSPSEAVIERCRDNLDAGIRPVLVTTQYKVSVAHGLAENAQLADRIDVFEVEQFVALNLYEKGSFKSDGRTTAIAELVRVYNSVIDEVETDPSLKIVLS